MRNQVHRKPDSFFIKKLFMMYKILCKIYFLTAGFLIKICRFCVDNCTKKFYTLDINMYAFTIPDKVYFIREFFKIRRLTRREKDNMCRDEYDNAGQRRSICGTGSGKL